MTRNEFAAICSGRDLDRVPLRLVGGAEVAIELPPAMSEAAWKHMIKLLDAMKEGYVTGQTEAVTKHEVA